MPGSDRRLTRALVGLTLGLTSTLLAGGGVRGGRVVGATDRIGAEPVSDRQTPENLAATLYSALGIPRTAGWQDTDGRPYEVYRGEPIPGLT